MKRRYCNQYLILGFFLFSFSLIAENTFQPGQAKVTVGILNVRNIAAAGGDVITTLKRGEVLNVIDRSTNESTEDGITDFWYKVSLPKKKTGWVFGGFISFEMNLEGGLRWKTINPGGGQKFTGLVVSNNGEIVAATEKGNIFISTDKGKSWKKLVPQALGASIGKINKLILVNKEIWAAASGENGGGVWKTTNTGKSWAQFSTAQGLSSNDVYDLAFQKDGSIVAATEKGMSQTKDGGQTWNSNVNGEELNMKILSIAVSQDGKVFAGTIDGLYAFIESSGVFGGTKYSWNRIGKGESNMGDSIYSVGVTPSGEVFAGTELGVSRSNIKELKKWSGVGGKSIVNVIYMDSSKILIGTDNGLNISTDNGLSWVTYKKENGIASNRVDAISVNPIDKTIWTLSGADGLSYHE
ncbi:SH3 domain-containing protein [Leptospira santarosai]|uniref:SH3 domain protein n=1 Tax=Leptospira santarosai serovar Arenal str. MAVJ 401 TaxID=1049976 RepID=M6K5T0_9LEPT|nr:SH3 domain-containing protein [Leptospira santarosai]EMN23062.1 SH3 domain protein [Leptospira santarosai serovar Arenal str. MAVJ 401]